jgi:hypothetical protein
MATSSPTNAHTPMMHRYFLFKYHCVTKNILKTYTDTYIFKPIASPVTSVDHAGCCLSHILPQGRAGAIAIGQGGHSIHYCSANIQISQNQEFYAFEYCKKTTITSRVLTI